MSDVVQQRRRDQVRARARRLGQRCGLQHVLGHGDRLAQVLPGTLALEQRGQFVQRGRAALQHAQRGGQRVQVGVAALEAAAAVLGEGRPGVQQPDVVEDQAVPGVEPELQLQCRAQGDRGERPVGGVEGVQLRRRAAQGRDRAVVEPHLADPPQRVHVDQRPVGAQFGAPVAEHERHRGARQHREVLRCLRAQQRRRPEAVHQAGVAAGGRVLQAVQQLEGGYRVPVRVVAVRGDRGAGEGEVVRVRFDPDVEQRAVVGDPHVPEGLRDRQHLPLHRRDAAQHREAGAADGGQHGGLFGRVGEVGVPVGLGDAAGEVGGVPELLVGLRPPVAVLAPGEPLGRVARAVPVRPEHLQVAVQLGPRGDRQIVRQVGDLEQLLPVARVAALGAGAVVAQPVRRQLGGGHGLLLGGPEGGGQSCTDNFSFAQEPARGR